MKFNLVCGKDEIRPVLSYVKVTPENIVATDATILLKAPTTTVFDEDFIELIPESGMLIHMEDWDKLSKANHIEWKQGMIKLNYAKKRSVIIEPEYESEVGNYPDCENAIPSNNMATSEHKIGVNANRLATLQKAVPFAYGTILSFYGNNRGMRVKFQGGDDLWEENYGDVEGLIMPILIIK